MSKLFSLSLYHTSLFPLWISILFIDFKSMNEDGRKTKQTVISKRQLSECLGETIYLRSLNNEYKLDVKK